MLFYGFIASMALNLLVIVLVSILLLKQRSQNKKLSKIGKEAVKGQLPHMISESYDKISIHSKDIDDLNKSYANLLGQTNFTLQNVGLFRYNAFEDTGGNQSFSLALLNNQKDGFVLTSINARTENRLYVKQVIAGKSNEHPLTPDEKRAIQKALKTSRKMYGHKDKVTS